MNDQTTTSTDEPQEAAVSAEELQATEQATVDPQAPDEPQEEPQDDHEPRSQEAKRYRLRARAAEEARDQLAAQLDAMRRAEITRISKGEGVPGKALFAHHGDELDGLLTEDGTVDSDKVAAAIQQARLDFGIHSVQVAPRAAGVQGNTGSPVVTSAPREGFTDAFKPRR